MPPLGSRMEKMMNVVNPQNYYHEQDRITLENLKAIPGFTQALKAFMKIFNEKILHGLNMSSKIRLGPNQLPELYRLLPPICEVLGIEEPEFYLEMDPSPNAYTVGDTDVSITVTSGLIDYMEEDEIMGVIAHECGHIACKHCLYHTMGNIILSSGADILGLGTLAIPLKLAFFHWQRCSEFSADRAAAVYLQGSNSVVEMMIRLAGGNKSITSKINTNLYLEQAKDYQELIKSSTWDKTLQYLILMDKTHPFTSVRASEIVNWCNSNEFQKILEFMKKDNTNSCKSCGADIEEGWKFCKHCGGKL